MPQRKTVDGKMWVFTNDKEEIDPAQEIDVKDLERKVALLKKPNSSKAPEKVEDSKKLDSAKARRLRARRLLDARKTNSGVGVEVDKIDQNVSFSSKEGDGERIPLERLHRIRALAQVKDGDFSIGVGPEVIVRDQNMRRKPDANEKSNVDPGVGFRLGIEF